MSFSKDEKKHKLIRFRDYKKFVENDFIYDLKHTVLFSDVLASNDPEVAWGIWKYEILQVFEKHAPVKERRLKDRQNPWVDESIVKLMYERDYLHKTATQSKDADLWEKYRIARNKVTTAIRYAKQMYFRNVVVEEKKEPKRLWSKLRKVYPSKRSTVTIPKDLTADDLNNYFSSIGHRVSSSIDSTNDIPWKGPESVYNFKFIEITNEFVFNFLKELPKNSIVDIFGMDTKLLQIGASFFTESLSHILNLSITNAVVVEEWKIASVTPIFKGTGDIMDESNYRPISIIGHIAKVLEKGVQLQFLQYLQEHDFISKDQSAYLKYHSTHTCLHKVVDEWLDDLNDGLNIGICFLDLKKKCFHAINHGILIQKLQKYGV